MKAEDRVKRTIESQQLIAPGDRVVLALSGGPDSLCLLHILSELRERLAFDLKALHVNHMLRGSEADADALWVEEHCRALGIPVRIVSCDVAGLAKEQGLSEEEAGRQVRYQALKEYAEGGLIALAHNRNDQAETVLFRLLRGSGVHGLAAMDYKRKDGVIRPLLDTPRDEIEEYCQRKGLAPRMDRTNSETEYTRNRIRLELIPQLEKAFNPNLQEALVRLAASARADDDLLNRMAEDTLAGCAADGGSDGVVVLEKEDLLALDPAIRARVLCLALQKLGLEEDLSFVHRQALEDLLQKGRGGKTLQLPGGYLAGLFAGRLTLSIASRQTQPDAETVLPTLVMTEWAGVLDLSLLQKAQKFADADKIEALTEPLTIRFRKTGDVITPVGMQGSKKLKDYLIDRKIPKEERDRIPLLCSGSQVLWVLGYDLSAAICIDKNTKNSLLLEMKYTL